MEETNSKPGQTQTADAVNSNQKRLKNILVWALTGQFGRLARAVLDQVLIQSLPLRRFLRNHSVIQKRLQEKQLQRIMATLYGADTPSMRKGIKVALILRDGDTYPKSSAFIRLIAPLTHPIARAVVSVKLYRENTTVVDDDTNACIVQRTAYDNEKTAEQFILNIRERNIPLILDNDDAFHDIDKTHPEHSLHAEKLAAMNHIVRAANQIWLSVPALKPSYLFTKSKISIIENSLDLRIWQKGQAKGKRPATPKSGPLHMVYVGTVTHDADFKMILPALDALAGKFPSSFTLTVIGVSDDLPDRPWINRIYQPKYGSIYPVFVSWLCSQGPFELGLAPLEDSEFNRGKSDIKCLDYLALGIVPVVSDVMPYQKPELRNLIIKAKNKPGDWERTLTNIVSNPSAFRDHAATLAPQAQEYIWEKRSSKAIAIQMTHLLKGLVE